MRPRSHRLSVVVELLLTVNQCVTLLGFVFFAVQEQTHKY